MFLARKREGGVLFGVSCLHWYNVKTRLRVVPFLVFGGPLCFFGVFSAHDRGQAQEPLGGLGDVPRSPSYIVGFWAG